MNHFYNYAIGQLMTVSLIVSIGIYLPYKYLGQQGIFYQIGITLALIIIQKFVTRYFIVRSFKEISQELIDKTKPLDDNSHQVLKQSISNTSMGYLFKNIDRIMTNYGKLIGENQIVVRELQDSNTMLESVIKVNNQLLQGGSSQAFYDLILESAVQTIGKGTHGSLMKMNANNKLNFVSLYGYDASLKSLEMDLQHTFLWDATDGNLDRAIITDNIIDFNRLHLNDDDYNHFKSNFPTDIISAISTPLFLDDTFYGLISVDSSEPTSFKPSDLDKITLFRSQVEIALKNKKLLDRTIYLSRYDNLTTIYNRSYFEDIMSDLIINSKLEDHFFSVIVIDIDGLKDINDTYGHKIGDQMLKDFSDTVKSIIKDTDIFARFGGDEFIAVFFDSHKLNTVNTIQLIKRQLNQSVKMNQRTYDVGFSYGISQYPSDSEIYNDLVNIADKNMHHMKALRKKEH